MCSGSGWGQGCRHARRRRTRPQLAFSRLQPPLGSQQLHLAAGGLRGGPGGHAARAGWVQGCRRSPVWSRPAALASPVPVQEHTCGATRGAESKPASSSLSDRPAAAVRLCSRPCCCCCCCLAAPPVLLFCAAEQPEQSQVAEQGRRRRPAHSMWQPRSHPSHSIMFSSSSSRPQICSGGRASSMDAGTEQGRVASHGGGPATRQHASPCRHTAASGQRARPALPFYCPMHSHQSHVENKAKQGSSHTMHSMSSSRVRSISTGSATRRKASGGCPPAPAPRGASGGRADSGSSSSEEESLSPSST